MMYFVTEQFDTIARHASAHPAVEDAIHQYPKVADVVVVGVPGPYGDDVIRCVVVPSTPCTAEEIVLYCRSQIATYKIPSRIEFRESLPKSPTGKIRRDSL